MHEKEVLTDEIKRFIADGTRDENGRTPLFYAAISGNLEVVELIIEEIRRQHGDEGVITALNEPDNSGTSILQKGYICGSEVEMLLNRVASDAEKGLLKESLKTSMIYNMSLPVIVYGVGSFTGNTAYASAMAFVTSSIADLIEITINKTNSPLYPFGLFAATALSSALYSSNLEGPIVLLIPLAVKSAIDLSLYCIQKSYIEQQLQ